MFPKVTFDDMSRCPTCGGPIARLAGGELADQQTEMDTLLAGHGHVTGAWRCLRAPCLELFWEVEPGERAEPVFKPIWSITYADFVEPPRQNRPWTRN